MVHLDVSRLKEPVLHLDVSRLQEPVLLLDISTLIVLVTDFPRCKVIIAKINIAFKPPHGRGKSMFDTRTPSTVSRL
jgi:hypothetical protein